MKYALIALLILPSLLLPSRAWTNFSGMSFTDSPVNSMEYIIDDVFISLDLKRSNPKELEQMKKAILKGSVKDKEILRNLVRMRKASKALSANDLDSQNSDILYLETVAKKFGYANQR